MSDLVAPIVQWRVEFLLRKKWIYPYGMHYKIRSKTMSEEALADICTTGLPVLGWKGLIICAQWLFEPYFSIFFSSKGSILNYRLDFEYQDLTKEFYLFL